MSWPAAVAYIGIAENTVVPSLLPPLIWMELRLGWDCAAAAAADVTNDEELQAAEGEAAILTKPVNRLRRGSAHRPPPLGTDVDGSKVKRPL